MKFVKNTIGIAASSAFFVSTALLGTAIIHPQFPALKEVTATLRCAVGVPDIGAKCVQDEMRSIEEERAQLEIERDALAKQNAAREARQIELAELSEAVKDFNLFQRKVLEFGTVTTGVKFKSVLEPETWSESWCYLKRIDKGLERHIDLANYSAGSKVRWHRVSNKALADAGITRAQLSQAQEACQFPEVAS